MKDIGGNRRASFGSFIVDTRGTILGFDQAMESLTLWRAIDVVGRHKDLSVTTDSDRRGRGPLMTVPLYDGRIPMEPRAGNLELVLHCRDGSRLDVETTTRRLEGPGDRLLVTVLQVLTRSARQNGARGKDLLDALTGLQGRDAFASRLASDLLYAKTTARPMAMIFLDVDRLRETNDRHGYAAGDGILQKLAGILRVSVDDDQRVARLGDDDFAILLPDAGRGEARQVAAGLRSTVERFRFFTSGPAADARITISLGAASFPADADSERELIERVREALDEARSMGRNRVWCYLRRPRVPLQVPVFFDGADPLLVGYTRDLSPSGIFVQTSAAIDIGMRCALAFPLPGLDGKVHVVGRVVRTVLPESAPGADVRIPGLGVEFERFGGNNDRRAIEGFLHDRESTSLRPETGLLSV